MPGPPSLQRLCLDALVRWKDCLGDVGSVPVWLLEEVLSTCTPQQLAHIEDATAAGSGRDLAPLTWPLWLSHLTSAFGAPAPGAVLPALPETWEGPAPPPQPGVPPADYR